MFQHKSAHHGASSQWILLILLTYTKLRCGRRIATLQSQFCLCVRHPSASSLIFGFHRSFINGNFSNIKERGCSELASQPALSVLLMMLFQPIQRGFDTSEQRLILCNLGYQRVQVFGPACARESSVSACVHFIHKC